MTGLILGLAVSACAAPRLISPVEPAQVESFAAPPPGSDPDSCWGKDVSPAVLETVTQDILVQPAQVSSDGTVLSEPIYKRETRQAIVTERREIWFETPCQDQLTPDIIATLQRALKARGLYRGALSGQMDAPTRAAIRRFQAREGLDSSILSLWAARKLGLVAIARA
ncbi:peptidoglycan-binding domain-containing protein [uncultured Lentibacter sp.]|uniref:peptidoglycan-binding domain-containing protein n=1 Tax=uncultured Lentibacter sp. TaxID=1659309 RepID=UPI00262939DA|nr:peptidoglycan-binding domain-containing protein [uncultured Lentibacter sp.]MCW1956685.1 peptidoglycan-binding protein [Roseobacter sp.]